MFIFIVLLRRHLNVIMYGCCVYILSYLAIAYIIKAAARAEKYLPLKAAVPHVKKAMVGTNPNDGFLVQLCKLEKDLWDEVHIYYIIDIIYEL